MRVKRKVSPGVAKTANNVDAALEVLAAALEDDGVNFIQLEKAAGAFYLRLMRSPPTFDARDD